MGSMPGNGKKKEQDQAEKKMTSDTGTTKPATTG